MRWVTALGRRMPFWQRDLALVILTSPGDAAQVAALERYRAHRALALPSSAPNATRDTWRRLLARDATPVRALRVGQRLEIDGVTIQTLDCDDTGGVNPPGLRRHQRCFRAQCHLLYARTPLHPSRLTPGLPMAVRPRIPRWLSPSIRRRSSSAMGVSPAIRQSRPTTNVQLAAHACTTNR
jgi:hypothetical protein